MDEFGGLPYTDEAVAAVQEAQAAEAEASTAMDVDHPMLDRPLDDYNPNPRGGRRRSPREPSEPVPEHVQSLLGRMGKGKVYLMDESPGIIHHDGELRLRRDPVLAKLARELDKQDPTQWLTMVSESASSPIRPNALFVSSTLIAHMSTAKIFTWASELGAAPMGIEWLNDTTLILLFASPAAALLGLSMLAKAGFDPTEGDDPLLERSAHGFPISLLPRAEPRREDRDRREEREEKEAARRAELDRQLDEEMRAYRKTEGGAAAGGAAEGSGGGGSGGGGMAADRLEAGGESGEPVRRRGRGAFTADKGAFDDAPAPVAFAEGVDLYARVTVRYALEGDNTKRKGAADSAWYARHGRGAGKEVAPRRGFRDEPRTLADRVGTRGEGRDLSRRIRAAPYERADRGEGRGERRSRVADLDADLDRMRGGGRERGGRRPQRNKDDLDRELEEMFAGRKEE